MNNVLNEYRMMSIDKVALCQCLGEDIYNADIERPLCIRATDVSNAIGRVLSGDKSLDDLVEWVNVVWFTDLFYFLEKETDTIISVLEILETLDEEDVCISDKEMAEMRIALNENREYVSK